MLFLYGFPSHARRFVDLFLKGLRVLWVDLSRHVQSNISFLNMRSLVYVKLVVWSLMFCSHHNWWSPFIYNLRLCFVRSSRGLSTYCLLDLIWDCVSLLFDTYWGSLDWSKFVSFLLLLSRLRNPVWRVLSFVRPVWLWRPLPFNVRIAILYHKVWRSFLFLQFLLYLL